MGRLTCKVEGCERFVWTARYCREHHPAKEKSMAVRTDPESVPEEAFKTAFAKEQEGTVYIRLTEALARVEELTVERKQILLANSKLVNASIKRIGQLEGQIAQLKAGIDRVIQDAETPGWVGYMMGQTLDLAEMAGGVDGPEGETAMVKCFYCEVVHRIPITTCTCGAIIVGGGRLDETVEEEANRSTNCGS